MTTEATGYFSILRDSRLNSEFFAQRLLNEADLAQKLHEGGKGTQK